MLDAGALLPGRTAAAWALGLPWLALPLAGRELRPWMLALLPLWLAPPDVPTWILGAAVLGIAAGAGWVRQPRWAWAALIGVQLVVGVVGWGRACARVSEEQAVIGAVLAELGPEDAVVAPWTWGARASVLATGAPYGLRWRSADRLLPPQREQWCRALPPRVLALPPQTVATDSWEEDCSAKKPPEGGLR